MTTSTTNIPQNCFTESIFWNNMFMSYKYRSVLHEEKTPYQLIQVFDTYAVGKLLTLDGKTMVSDKDEFVYHEVITHIPSMVVRDASNVLVIGGGDGGAIRELVKYPHYKVIDLVEIDEGVTRVCREFFPQCTSGLADSRVKIYHEDGINFVKNKQNFYDIIIIDSTDPQDMATGLFTQSFYSDIFHALKDSGVMVAQAENIFLDQYNVKEIFDNMKKVFPIVEGFTAPITIYPGVFWNFAFASKKFQPTDINPSNVELMHSVQEKLQWYNMDWHLKAAFTKSNFQKRFY